MKIDWGQVVLSFFACVISVAVLVTGGFILKEIFIHLPYSYRFPFVCVSIFMLMWVSFYAEMKKTK